MDAGRSSGRVLTLQETTLLAGKFLVAFDEESAALGAARECRSVAFVAEVSQAGSGWVLSASRKNLFPADERDRYATRLQRICGPLGGRYDRFVRS
jgi:hypothetical protein